MNQMVTEFETLDKLNDALNDLQNGEVGDAVVTLVALKNKYQRICDEFDKWADEQSKINEEIEAGQLELQEAYLPNYGTNQ